MSHSHEYPNTLLATQQGNVKVSAFGYGVKGVQDETPAQLKLTELLPEIYGVIIRKCGPAPKVISYFVVDGNMTFACQEQSRVVDFKVHNDEIHALVTEYHLEFTDELEWLECIRLLEQAKSRLALRMLNIQKNLKVAAAEEDCT
ncbi:hypothetical protein L226DRAFT_523598 [Lentinus tigrinus ALCF2SS1-7]|uniref:uncharacterized protein n=1 Tax=Lentinus tigrinus ALCF2SS1-7 TaxID=1328758 RepID=UPI001165FA18|nr:hypothetical protein L226DRAFT_523598 [Lentinus tigrinus ALCF2SS1-7]